MSGYEFYPIPTQYVQGQSPGEIRNLARYLKNPIEATLDFKTGDTLDAFNTEGDPGEKNTEIRNGDLFYQLDTLEDTHLVVEATWNVDGQTITAEAIINFRILSEDEAETHTFEWFWFPPITVFVGDTGAFSGVIAKDIDENLNNPSGAEATFSVASKSTSISIGINHH